MLRGDRLEKLVQTEPNEKRDNYGDSPEESSCIEKSLLRAN